MKDNEVFLKRTDDLGLKLRMNLTDLARHVGLSDGSFFGYRTGRVTISAKAWRKLEAAEKAAGIEAPQETAHVGGFPEPPHVGGGPETSNVGRFTDSERLERIEAELARLTTAVESLRAGGIVVRPPPVQHAPANVLEFPGDAELVELPYFGTVAAGMPGGPVDIEDGTIPVPGNYDPARHFTLRVAGRSMEPDYPDERIIICRRLRDGEFAKKNQDVIACDSSGAYFKKLLYVKGGQMGDKPRKAVPSLVSINPDFPDVVPVSDCPIVAVVVALADSKKFG